MKKLGLVLIICFNLVLFSGGAFAQTTDTLDVQVNVASIGKLTVDLTQITFEVDSDPDTEPTIPTEEGDVTVEVKVRHAGASNATLDHLAIDFSPVPTGTLDIGDVSWTAAGANFVGGTMNSTTAQNVGTFANSGSYTGVLTYTLPNSWDYQVGSFTAAATTFTLTVP